MGKNLKGKELGTGISQRKDGYYVGRFTARDGTRQQKLFKKLQECRNWVADAQHRDEIGCLTCLDEDIIVDDWFKYWISIKENNVRYITAEGYKKDYRRYITGQIGKLKVKDVTPVHLQMIMAQMANHGLKAATLQGARSVLFNMFDYAVDNNLICKNPCDKTVKSTIGRQSEQRKAMTLEEQRQFIDMVRKRKHKNQYLFVLQTGIRTAELVGLRWHDIDFEHKTMTIRRSMRYYPEKKEWKTNDTKTLAGLREIPLTDEAIEILLDQKQQNAKIKVVQMEWADTVFLDKKGFPVNQTNYNQTLARACEKAGMRTISMHLLRHTFATRCIEAGMTPKTLQVILGHSNIKTTLNLYVTATEEQKRKEVDKMSEYLAAI